jgi:hypothetical protein
LVAGVESVNINHLDEVHPWNLDQVVVYEPGYLSGFRVQRYQIELDQAFELTKPGMQPTIDAAIRRDIGGDDQRIHTQSTTYRNRTFKYLLLPVWIASYRHKTQSYQVMINGETGKVAGDHPYSVFKVLLAVGTTCLVALALLWLIGIVITEDSSSPEPQSSLIIKASEGT